MDPIYKITPISGLVSYKGSLLVEPSRRYIGERKKKKERNFCWKSEYLRPLLRVGGGIIKKQHAKLISRDVMEFESECCGNPAIFGKSKIHLQNCLSYIRIYLSLHKALMHHS